MKSYAGKINMIWISQWLCPVRHCSIVIAWDKNITTAEEVEKNGEKIFSSGQLNRRCGLCGGALHVAHGQSIFDTLEEAEPYLRLFEQRQMAMRASLRN